MNKTSKLKLWDSIAIIVAIVVGVGIFRTPLEVSKYLRYPGLILLAWLVGGIISFLGALCYARLSYRFPHNGGNYVYLKESYGTWSGFLFGWTELLVIRTGSIAAVSFICADYMEPFFALPVKAMAVGVIVIVTIVNLIGLTYSKITQNIFAISKILAICGIVYFGISKGKMPDFNFSFNKEAIPYFGLALVPILWTYGGWHENTFMAGETVNPRRNVPLALIISVSAITLLYLIISFMFLMNANILPVHIFVILSSIGCINAMVMTGSRVTYEMAKDNILFKFIGKLDDSIPRRAIILNSVVSIILVLLGTFNKLLFFTGIVVWLFFVLIALALLRYKLTIVPIVFGLICAALFINTLFFYTVPSLIGLGILLSGIPVYLISRR